jgi:tricorn protease
LLSVNGQDVDASKEIYSYFQGTAGKATVLRVSKDSDLKNSREVTVIPVHEF